MGGAGGMGYIRSSWGNRDGNEAWVRVAIDGTVGGKAVKMYFERPPPHWKNRAAHKIGQPTLGK